MARGLYGALFVILLPAALLGWAAATDELVGLPVCGNPAIGTALALAGLAMILWAMSALWFQGGGLPMNAFPPPRYVSTGLYRLLPHPIYAGFTLACLGVSMAARSASGMWLVTPAVGLGCAALVLGYEAPDLRRRFGSSIARCTWLPASADARPATSDHGRFLFFVLLPWIAIYEIVISIGVPPDGIDLTFGFERRMPVWPWTEAIYASIYPVAALAAWLAPSRRSLRLLMLRAWVAMAIVFPLYLALPVLAPHRAFTPADVWGRLLAWERSCDPPVAAFPSFHVIWAMLLAQAAAARGPRWRMAAWIWAAAVSLSCITTGMHSVADVAAGAIFAWMLIRADRVWEALRAATERVANSWREWRIGPVRILNHGIYAGAAAFCEVAIVAAAVGPGHNLAIVATAFGAILGAGLWAQGVEGSPQLLRPFGFYGGFFGVIATAAAGAMWGWDSWLFIAAYSLGAPVMQSLGRLRCLVQGCCHGAPASPAIGIQYTHPRSRVSRLAHLEGLPLHPTPLYSILWNGFIFVVMARLWSVGAPLHAIAGLYAVLTGLGRFVEEGYRGEPQTPVWAGLRLYQWIAVGTITGGALITALGRSAAAPRPAAYGDGWLLAAAFGLLAGFALGVDFPASNRRFSRLA